MIACPNKSLPEWKNLVDKVGENKAYVLWNEYNFNDISNNITSIIKPSINVKYLSNKEIVDSEDPRNLKLLEDTKRKDVKRINDLINCIWS